MFNPNCESNKFSIIQIILECRGTGFKLKSGKPCKICNGHAGKHGKKDKKDKDKKKKK